MTKTEYEYEIGRVHERRDASLRRLKRQGMTLDQITAATGFSRRLVATVCRKPKRVPGGQT